MNNSNTIEHAGQPNLIRVYLIAIVAAIGGFTFGYDLCIMSSAILYLKPFFHLTPAQEGFAMISAVYGVFAGLAVAGPTSDRLGRRLTLFLAAVLFGISAIGTALPKTLLMWNVFRIIGGVGGGIAAVVSPLYIAEMSPARMRGRLVLMNQIAIVVAILTAAIVAYRLSPIGHQWRWMFASEMPPIIALAAFLWMIPESPRWLVQAGRVDDARKVLASIGGRNSAENEMGEIQRSLAEESGKLSELFAPGIRMALIVAVAVAVFQQTTGASTILFYAPTIFKSAGIVKNSAAIANAIIIDVFLLAFTVIAVCIVDRQGRRPMLLFGALGMAVGQILMGLLFQFKLPLPYALPFMLVAVGAYTLSFAPLGWLVMAEVFPTRIRARAMAVATVTLQIGSIAANGFFPVVRDYTIKTFGSPASVFYLFAVISVLAFVFCCKYVPETKGRTLEEIAGSWAKKKSHANP